MSSARPLSRTGLIRSTRPLPNPDQGLHDEICKMKRPIDFDVKRDGIFVLRAVFINCSANLTIKRGLRRELLALVSRL